MARLQGLMVALFYTTCLLQEVHLLCLQNTPELIEGDIGAFHLPNRIQVLVPAYSFTCYGRVVEWGACVGPGERGEEYGLTFQIWRQASDAVYQLIESNTFKIRLEVDERCVRAEVVSQNQILVEPGDIMGYYSDHLVAEIGGVVVENTGNTTRSDVAVWYTNTSEPDTNPGYQVTLSVAADFSVTSLAPVILASVETMSAQVMPATSLMPVMTARAETLSTPAMPDNSVVSVISTRVERTVMPTAEPLGTTLPSTTTSLPEDSNSPQNTSTSIAPILVGGVTGGLAGIILITVVIAAIGIQIRRFKKHRTGTFDLRGNTMEPMIENQLYQSFSRPSGIYMEHSFNNQLYYETKFTTANEFGDSSAYMAQKNACTTQNAATCDIAMTANVAYKRSFREPNQIDDDTISTESAIYETIN